MPGRSSGMDQLAAQAVLASQIWSTQTALLLRSCRGHDGEVTDLAINRDNTMVASSSNDTTIRCWSLEVPMLQTHLIAGQIVAAGSLTPAFSAFAVTGTACLTPCGSCQ